jgi:hypothetical protein
MYQARHEGINEKPIEFPIHLSIQSSDSAKYVSSWLKKEYVVMQILKIIKYQKELKSDNFLRFMQQVN